MKGDDREKQTAGNVRSLCPCETNAENPGPHIPSCPWSDPDYEPAGGFFPAGLGEDAMRAAAADALGIEPHEVAIVPLPHGFSHVLEVDDQAIAEVAPSGASFARFEKVIGDAELQRARCTLPARLMGEPRPEGYGQADHEKRDRLEGHTLATETDPAKVRQLARLVGFDRGVRDMDPRAAQAAAMIAAGGFSRAVAEQAIAVAQHDAEEKARRAAVDGGLILRRPPPERCPWVKVAGVAEQVRCLREPHDTDEDCQNHDWSGPLEPRQPLITSRGAGAFAPPVVRVDVTGEPGTVGWLRARLEGVPGDMPVTVRAWDEDGGDVCGGLTGAGVEHAHDEDDTPFFALDSSPDDAEETGS